MNYGWLYPDTPDQEYSRVVLHEFGHALGAIHEHQHPEAAIPWDKPKVYEYYARWLEQGEGRWKRIRQVRRRSAKFQCIRSQFNNALRCSERINIR